MATLVIDPDVEGRILAERRATGADRYDEVWDGVYVMSPLADIEHQLLVGSLVAALHAVMVGPGLGAVYPGVNVSDREEGWQFNYRVPDLAVYLPGNPAKPCGTHWVGGPDFAAEIVSRDDRSRDKLDFYAAVGVRELLLIDRAPWSLELFRLAEKKLVSVGRSTLPESAALPSRVLPLGFRLVAGPARPQVELAHADGARTWIV